MKPFLALLCCALGFSLSARAEQPPQPTVLDCDNADMWSVGNETQGVCTGSVKLTGTDLRIVCDKLEFAALGVGDKTSTVPTLDKFKYMIATGHVIIVQGDREAICGRAELLPQDDKIILTIKPQLIDHGTGWNTQGEKITITRGDRRVIVEKPTITGPAIRDLGFDPSKPATPGDGVAKPVPAK
jgi:hypothetical protein